MNLKHALTRNPVVQPPKSRANAKLPPIAAERRRAPRLPTVCKPLNVECDAVQTLLDGLVAGRYDVLIFMTGGSVWSLFVLAQQLGRQKDLLHVLQATTTACRSPKAAAILRRFKVEPKLGAPGMYTTRRLIHLLGRLDLAGRRVVRLNGAPGDLIANRLRDQRARVRELSISHRSTPIKASMSELFSLIERSSPQSSRPLWSVQK